MQILLLTFNRSDYADNKGEANRVVMTNVSLACFVLGLATPVLLQHVPHGVLDAFVLLCAHLAKVEADAKGDKSALSVGVTVFPIFSGDAPRQVAGLVQ